MPAKKPHSTWDRLEEYLKEFRGLFADIREVLNNILCAIRSRDVPPQVGHMMLHVTAVELKPQENEMPAPVDVTPELSLPATSVRGKISVVDPRRPPNNERVTSVTWSLSDESEPGAGELALAPDDTVKDENGNEVIDPTDNLPLNVYSVFANTPLEPPDGTRASFKVKASAPGMADCTKVVSYGNAPVGHFTMVGVEAPEA
jgi:hypothetical protein